MNEDAKDWTSTLNSFTIQSGRKSLAAEYMELPLQNNVHFDSGSFVGKMPSDLWGIFDSLLMDLEC